VGIAGIIVSLIFLGYELKRSNDIAETEAVTTIYGMTNEMNLAFKQAGSTTGFLRIRNGCLRVVESIRWLLTQSNCKGGCRRCPM